jgi:hypothetical protein
VIAPALEDDDSQRPEAGEPDRKRVEAPDGGDDPELNVKVST